MENRLETLQKELESIELEIARKKEGVDNYFFVIQKQQELCHKLQCSLDDDRCVRNDLKKEIGLLQCKYKAGDVFEVNMPCFSHVKIVRVDYTIWGRYGEEYRYTLKYKSKDTKRWNGGGTHPQNFLESILQGK